MGYDRGRRDSLSKLALGLKIWLWAIQATIELRRRELPAYVGVIRRSAPDGGPANLDPRRLSRAVDKTLSVGRLTPRCIVRSLVLFRLLNERGHSPQLVIGLAERAEDHRAHAWVELDGADVGPRPGSHGHQEMARF